jgi:predicted Zn-dependent peptidase
MLKPITLKNGMNLLRFPKTGSNTFIIGFVVKTGSNIEEGNFPQGISKLVEKMFWKGTYKHSSAKHLNLALESIGGEFISYTTQELTHFYLQVPDYNQFKAISFLAEILQRSYFDNRDVEAEKKSMVENIKFLSQDMEYESRQLMYSSLYNGYSLSLPVEGFLDSVIQITHPQVLEYLSHQYNPALASLVLAGSFDSKKTVELIEQEWSVWNPKLKTIIESPKPNEEQIISDFPKVVYRQRGVAQTFLNVAFILDEGLAPMATNSNEANESDAIIQLEKSALDNRLAQMVNLMVLNCILGQGYSSRLWTKGVEEEVLFNTVDSKIGYFSNTSFLYIEGSTDNLQFSFALECILSTLDSLKKTTVSINELSKAKSYLRGRLIREHEELKTATVWAVENYLGSGQMYDLQNILDLIEKVEAPSIRSLALDLFVPQRLSITTLGTAKENRIVDRLIVKYLG